MEKYLEKTEKCWCGSDKLYGNCHFEIDRKIRQYAKLGHIVPTREMIKNEKQIDGIRQSGLINNAVLDYVSENIKLGMSTEEIDKLVYEKTTELGAIPAPLGYDGFPKSVCTSINDQVCHGIPSDKIILKDGDIINVDVSTIYNGYFSDASRMFLIGNVSDENKRLVEVTKEAIYQSLEKVKPWNFLGDMADVINKYAKKNGYSVVKDVGGHGVGIEFHEDPYVSYVAKPKTEMLLVPGMVFTIEPMINMGTAKVFIDGGDNWAIYTGDGKPSAQWEITVLVTNDGYEILAY